jgi:hypothetical protein
MVIKYFPPDGLSINNIDLKWKEDRTIIRNLLNNTHSAADQFIDLSKDFGGNDEYNIDLKRDVYTNLFNSKSLFFLNYSKNNLLRDVEIHSGIEVQLNNIIISFDLTLKQVIYKLGEISKRIKKVDINEYYFEDLKLIVADKKKMGNKGNTLGYVYFTDDTSHLMNL